MSDWSAGYVTEIGYTYGYYPELNPLRTRLIFLYAGLACPEFGTACELGFGQGLSANLHAAASVTQWCGTDFNPSQAAFAQELARASGGGARLYDEAFADFAQRDDLPDFDYIALHGIWSWISDENRHVIVDFIRRKLKVGGVLYISYNTQPGWASFAPMRHLMTQHADVMGIAGGGTVSRINGAIEFAEKLLATKPAYSRANLQISERLEKLKSQSRHYLAHEYFNRDWQPMHFATMAGYLAAAKLSYACSAHHLDHIDEVNFKPAQKALLKEIPDAMFRESVRDFLVNQQFRRDYWVKGPRKLGAVEQAEALRAQKFILVTPRSSISLTVTGAGGEAALNEPIYNPILDALSGHKGMALGELELALTGQKISFSQIVQSVMVLSGAGHLLAVQENAAIESAKPQTAKLNAVLINKARSNGDLLFLASPVTGSGVAVGRFQQLFLLGMMQGKNTPAELAAHVWQIISSQGQRLLKEGETLVSAQENIAELTAQAILFNDKQLPILRALQVV